MCFDNRRYIYKFSLLHSSKWNLLYICGHEDHNILSNTRYYLLNHTFKCKRFLKMPDSTCKATNAGYYPMHIKSSSKTNLLSNIKLLLCHRDYRLKRTFFTPPCLQTERHKKSSRQWRLHYDQPDFPSTSLEPFMKSCIDFHTPSGASILPQTENNVIMHGICIKLCHFLCEK